MFEIERIAEGLQRVVAGPESTFLNGERRTTALLDNVDGHSREAKRSASSPA